MAGGQSQGVQQGGHAAGGQQGVRRGQQPRRPTKGNQVIFFIKTFTEHFN